ncbi:four helix bundle protein [Pseudomonas sp. GCM10022186]|uniref:four helix bundle protein n=1 Tax=Pseudomonas sp. GCM10022186 TaxID=3252650 RepID=UPI003612E7FD
MNFEKLEVWKRAARLSADLYRQLRDLNDFGFKDQITRAGLSIPSNIAEGMSREGEREKIRFLLIAKGSCAELRTQLYIGLDVGFVPEAFAKFGIRETREIAAMLSSLIRVIRQD